MVYSQFPSKSCRQNLCVNPTLLVIYHSVSYSNPPKNTILMAGYTLLCTTIKSLFCWFTFPCLAGDFDVGAYPHGQVHVLMAESFDET